MFRCPSAMRKTNVSVEEYRRLSLSAVGPDDVSALKKAAALAALDFDELMACLPGKIDACIGFS